MMKIFLLLCITLAFAPPAGAQYTIQAEREGCSTVPEWGAPGALRAADDPQGIRVSWLPSTEAPSPAEGFEIVRATDLAGPYEALALMPNTATEYIDSRAAPGSFYYYRVRAFQGQLCSPFSDPVRGSRE